MRGPALTILPLVLAGLILASCSTPVIPGDKVNLQVRDPTTTVESQDDPNAEPGVNSDNPIVPQP
ncbi:hypothetical protein FFK22_023620 [Mycobacterium sp. KBS0706]|uniref:hypothetical protein n=1 Tax=Mycobacterium sp. KBS0706 TaxID=2578109 RepID=UPI00110FDC10|nr:hypothetical protein [Mycobacterium sp. KBS0706]TSD86246.1 hypothetical protein FFK22_023620 [Mycobacterium sp. KBS0706]